MSLCNAGGLSSMKRWEMNKFFHDSRTICDGRGRKLIFVIKCKKVVHRISFPFKTCVYNRSCFTSHMIKNVIHTCMDHVDVDDL